MSSYKMKFFKNNLINERCAVDESKQGAGQWFLQYRRRSI